MKENFINKEKGNFLEKKREIIKKKKYIEEMLQNELKYNKDFSESIKEIKENYEQIKKIAFHYIEKIKKEGMSEIEYFISNPVLTRTDFGYSDDVDITIIYDDTKEKPIAMESDIENVFIMPKFISIKKINNFSSII